jgi:hypothetical protein
MHNVNVVCHQSLFLKDNIQHSVCDSSFTVVIGAAFKKIRDPISVLSFLSVLRHWFSRFGLKMISSSPLYGLATFVASRRRLDRTAKKKKSAIKERLKSSVSLPFTKRSLLLFSESFVWFFAELQSAEFFSETDAAKFGYRLSFLFFREIYCKIFI